MARDYGTITWQGKTLRLTNIPQSDNYQDTIAYYGCAEDDDGNFYNVRWSITDAWANREPTDGAYDDESDACDWDNPAEVSLY